MKARLENIVFHREASLVNACIGTHLRLLTDAVMDRNP
jgi:hypothetical protein